ncbi:hypothetical protein GF322_00830 [Candidatus Dependentiae bacterium]|nr:hypothetical protein [Candidatus Dependentiae bacterium]
MKKKIAFTLIEFSIYLSLFSIFCLLTFNFLITINRNIFFSISKNEKFIRKNVAFDLLRRDLMCASAKLSDWDQNKLIFRKNILNKKGKIESFCIGWEILKGDLIRIDGEYDFITKNWIKRNLSKAFANLKNLNFTLKLNRTLRFVKSVEVEVQDQIEIIKLRNGFY